MAGLDHVAHLNLAGPRDFLLQLEDDLDTFVSSDFVGDVLEFPLLAQPYADLLATTAKRYHLEPVLQRENADAAFTSIQHRPDRPPELPLFCYPEFMLPQIPVKTAELTGSKRISRLRRRLQILNPSADKECDLGYAQGAVDEALRKMALDSGWASKDKPLANTEIALMSCKAERLDGCKNQNAQDLDLSGLSRGMDGHIDRVGEAGDAKVTALSTGATDTTRRKRGRGFLDTPDEPRETMEVEKNYTKNGRFNASRPRHDYTRFSPKAVKPPFVTRTFAPWPSVKLKRSQSSVVWRPEWRVGPDVDDPRDYGPQFGSLGGILSFAVHPSQFQMNEGFEVYLRAGPGPSEKFCDSDNAGGGNLDEEPPTRDDDDFVLSFRRDDGAWALTGGRSARLPDLRPKIVADLTSDKRLRHTFWVACLHCKADSKHYVVCGRIPGILSEHFFVAKVARNDSLSHVGFSYNPVEGGKVARDAREITIENITAYPHGLTGYLPFISLKFIEEKETANDTAGCLVGITDCLLSARLRDDPIDAENAEATSQHPSRPCKNLCVLQKPVAQVDPNLSKSNRLDLQVSSNALHSATWQDESRRECGLPTADTALDRQRRAERRAKRACTPVTVNRAHMLEAPVSWEPQESEMPALGGFEDTLRHDPVRWAARAIDVEI